MNKHGFARNSEFTVYKVTDSSVTLVLKDSAFTKEFYPYSFSFYVTHTLLKNGFTTNYRIVNQSDSKIHFNIGGHVGVRCPILPEEEFQDYEIAFDKPLTLSAYFTSDDNPIEKGQLSSLMKNTDTLSLSYDLFKKGAVIIDQIGSHNLQLRHRQNHRGVSFEYDGFPVLALWTFGKKKAPYLCLEPWHGLPAMDGDSEIFMNKSYIISLKPEESKQLQYTLKFLDNN
jgi:galactose mutarotase-like enzyme